MEIKTFDDILKLKEEFDGALQQRIKKLERATIGTLDEMIEEKRAVLKQSKTRLDAAVQAKTEALKRLDDEIRRHQDMVARLECDIEELRKSKESAEKSGPGKPSAKGKRRPQG